MLSLCLENYFMFFIVFFYIFIIFKASEDILSKLLKPKYLNKASFVRRRL